MTKFEAFKKGFMDGITFFTEITQEEVFEILGGLAISALIVLIIALTIISIVLYS